MVRMPGSSLTGRLIVATPDLEDPNFRRAVVLLLEHGPEGAVGVVLDRPLDALEVPVRAGLRLGVQQLITGVPAHAAVGETVAGFRLPERQPVTPMKARTPPAPTPAVPEPRAAGVTKA